MAGLLDTAQGRLMGLLNIPTELQRFATNPQAFLSLLGVNKLPKETGFAAGATGLPAQNVVPGGILNPPNLAYQQGYEQGEPLSYAAMAAPMAIPAGKAIAPKAYDMLENYMVQTGGMLPLTAYHGTPHTIQGKFDINKVGTGEGAQAYGHGMYFAENPNVAKEYQKMLAGPEQTAAEYLKMYKTPESAISVLEGGIKPNLTAEAKQHSLDAINVLKSGKELKGNLYKVDIPDEYIPNMLDWNKPLSEMTKKEAAIIDPLKKQLVKSKNPYLPESFDTVGQVIQFSRGSNPNLEKELLEAGIPGIKYLDEGSRGTGKGTRNFVVFDPTDVKILEKNSQKVEGLLD
jgi:hypothetical protein